MTSDPDVKSNSKGKEWIWHCYILHAVEQGCQNQTRANVSNLDEVAGQHWYSMKKQSFTQYNKYANIAHMQNQISKKKKLIKIYNM